MVSIRNYSFLLVEVENVTLIIEQWVFDWETLHHSIVPKHDALKYRKKTFFFLKRKIQVFLFTFVNARVMNEGVRIPHNYRKKETTIEIKMKNDSTHWHIPEHDQNVKKTVVIVVELLNLENSLRIISFLLQSERMSSKSPSEKREMKIEDRRRIGCFFLWKFIRSFRFTKKRSGFYLCSCRNLFTCWSSNWLIDRSNIRTQ